ncbi:iron complex transport system ATP-binding protein [Actinacidiphila alni]|uniref:Iron complex transport system ATP-binding protein n=1 Tax=Actinacidiphila alni TaxID=380248 RepID=A0A1I2K0K5_9ACTN|nr:ABC transporter ATP-binding protein [Actinacidiphila alni]SFF59750.1 iron complex transport system ATP-binding protein [Actinacidiphila alni]
MTAKPPTPRAVKHVQAPGGHPARVEIRDLRVAYAGRDVVSGVRLLARDGEIVGLVGPNGSGKSSVLRCVYRHLRPSGGTVLLDGTELAALSPAESARRVAALPQERGGGSELSVRDVVAMGRVPHQRAFAAENTADRAAVDDALARTSLTALAGRRFDALSGGERQRVLLARAFAQRARVLVLDEPTNHLDLRHQTEVLALLRAERRTTLICLHDLNAAAALCDRLHVLHRGAVVASGAPREVLTPGLLAEVFGIRAVVVEHPLTGGPLIAMDHTAAPAHRERGRDGADRGAPA